MHKSSSCRSINKLHKDYLGVGGTTTLNRRTSKINVLQVIVFQMVTEVVMDLVIDLRSSYETI
jgi:hypothetical protein